MRIEIVIHGLNTGGIERIGVDYANLLYEAGNEVTIVNLNPDENELVNELRPEIKYHEYRFDRKFCPELYSYCAMNWWWGKYLYPLIYLPVKLALQVRLLLKRKNNFDISIAMSGHMNDLSYVSYGFDHAYKRIAWCHGTLLSYLAICDGYSSLYKRIDTIVALSDIGQSDVFAGRKYLKTKLLYKQYNPSFILSRSVDKRLSQCLVEQYGDFVLMIARIAPPKDHETAILAMKELKRRGLNKTIIFLGDGEKSQSVKRFAKEQGMAENCIFKGNVSNVQDYLDACHIGLLSSKNEGLPTAVIETMAFSKPCVMTNCDDGELSGFGSYCMLVPIGDYKAIADALEDLYQNEKNYKRYSQLSSTRFHEFEPEVVKNSVLEIISETLAHSI